MIWLDDLYVQIYKIRDSVEDGQSKIAWQTINEVSRRKSTAKAKLKATNQQERIKLWKQHFENLQGNPPKVTHETIMRIISKQLDIQLGPFTLEKLDSVLRKIKNRKAAGLDEIPPEVWKTRQFNDTLLRHCNAVYNQNPIDRWLKGCILPFPKKDDLGLAKNYRGITLTSIAAKIYNALLRNRVEPKIDNNLKKNQNGFRWNRSMTSQILTIRRILEGVRAKNLQVTMVFVDFTKAFDSIYWGKMEKILLAYGILKETVAAIMILYRNTKVKVRSLDGDRLFRHCSGRTAKRHTSPYLFIICVDYVLRTSIDKIKGNGFELTKKRSRRYPAKTITDAYYADAPNQAETLQHSLERAAAGIGLHVNAHKMEYMCFNQTGDISTLGGSSLKLVDNFTYLGSSVSSPEKDIDTRLTKVWTAIDRLSIIWKSDLTDKIKRSFYQAAVVSVLLYGCTTYGRWLNRWRKILTTTQECCELFWTSPGGNNIFNSSGFLISLWKPFQVRQLLLVSPFTSCSTVFLLLLQGSNTCPSFPFSLIFTLLSIDRFLFVHIPFGRMVKFLIQCPVDHFLLFSRV